MPVTRVGSSGERRLFPSPNTRKIVFITFFSSLYLYGHVGTLYLQARGLNLLQAGSLWSVIVATIFVAEVPTGVVADRLGRKRAVIAALALQFLGEALYIFSSTYLAFAAIAVIAGIGFAFLSGSLEALIYASLPADGREDAMKRAMSLNGGAYYAAFLVAPLVGSLLLPVFVLPRFLFTVFLTACSVFVALLIALTLDDAPVAAPDEGTSALGMVRAGVDCIRANPFLRRLVAVSVLTATFFGTLAALFQPYLHEFGWDARALGLAAAAGAGLAVLVQVSLPTIERVLGKQTTLTLSVLLPGLGYLLMGVAGGAWIAALAFVLTYGLAEAKNPLLAGYQNSVIPEPIRATVLSLVSLLVSLYAAVIGLVMGRLADIHVSYPFYLAGALILFFAAVLRVDTVLRRQ